MTIARYEDDRVRLRDYGPCCARGRLFGGVHARAPHAAPVRRFARGTVRRADRRARRSDLFCFFRARRSGFRVGSPLCLTRLRRAGEKPAFVALAGWIAFTALISYDPATSLKRAALCLLVSGSAAMAPLLPRGRSEMAQLVAIAAAIPLALSYLGVLLAPDLAIHSAADTARARSRRRVARRIRPQEHRQPGGSASSPMLASTWSAKAGVGQGFALAAASIVFLMFTNGKTSTALWLPALLVGLLWRAHAGVLAVCCAGAWTGDCDQRAWALARRCSRR